MAILFSIGNRNRVAFCDCRNYQRPSGLPRVAHAWSTSRRVYTNTPPMTTHTSSHGTLASGTNVRLSLRHHACHALDHGSTRVVRHPVVLLPVKQVPLVSGTWAALTQHPPPHTAFYYVVGKMGSCSTCPVDSYVRLCQLPSKR